MNTLSTTQKTILILTLIILVSAGIFFWTHIHSQKLTTAIKSVPSHLSALAENTTLPSPVTTLSEPTKIDPATVTILIYHNIKPYEHLTRRQQAYDIDPAMFAKQMQYLVDNGYAIISMRDLLKHFEDNSPLPTNAVIINFDDGWKSQYDEAYPVLKKLGLTATFFIYPSNISVGHAFMTWDNLKELQSNGMDIEGHSMTHPILTHITDTAKLHKEIYESKKLLENKLGQPIKIFAYPYGIYDDHIIDMVQDAGYQMARTIHNGKTQPEDARYKLRGYLTPNDFTAFLKILQSK